MEESNQTFIEQRWHREGEAEFSDSIIVSLKLHPRRIAIEVCRVCDWS